MRIPPTVLLLALPALGQLPTAVDRGTVPIHSAVPDASGAVYGTWGAGRTYKASFHGDPTFVPHLGDAYPRTRRWSWHTTSLRVGETELRLSGEDPGRWHDDRVYEYRHCHFTERYEVREEALAQSFLVPARPGPGDLVLTGRVATDLQAAPEPGAHTALTFHDGDGTAILGYGAATAIDAEGRRLALATRYRDRRITITVPARWLDEAAWPVTVDPLLARQTIASGASHGLSDIAREDGTDHILVTYVVNVSSTDKDVIARLYLDGWGQGTTVFADLAAWNTPEVACAAAGTAQDFCIAFSRFLFGSWEIYYRIHPGSSFGFSSSAVSIPNVTNGHQWRPDVGGTRRGPGSWIVVYQLDVASTFQNTAKSRIVAALIDPSGNVTRRMNMGFTLYDDERPTVNQSKRPRLTGSHWTMVWQSHDDARSNPEWRVFARQIDELGNASTTRWLSGSYDGIHQLGPRIAGSDGRYLVAFATSPTSLVGRTGILHGHGVATQRLDWPGGGTPTSSAPADLIAPTSSRALVLGDVAYDHGTRSHWAVQVVSDRRYNGSGRALLSRTGYRGRHLERVTLESPPTRTASAVRGGVAFDPDGDLFLASWAMAPGNVSANKYTYDGGSCITRSGTTCTLAMPGWSGSEQIGSEFSRVTLQGAPPNMPAFLLAGLVRTNIDLTPYRLPGCLLLVPGSGPFHAGMWATTTSGSGTASVRIPLPEHLPAMTAFFQWFHLQPAGSPIPLAGTYRLEVCLLK